jgi:hypothetical protein
MMISLRALLLSVLAAGLFDIDAQAQMPDGTTSRLSATDAVEARPTGIGDAVPETRGQGKPAPETGHNGTMAIDSGGATRREVLARLFAGSEVEIEWRNKALGDEKVWGHLSGPPAELVRSLLARGSYLAVYDTGDKEPRLARIVIFGSDPPSGARSTGVASSARQDARTSEAARRRAAIEAARRAIKAAKRR